MNQLYLQILVFLHRVDRTLNVDQLEINRHVRAEQIMSVLRQIVDPNVPLTLTVLPCYLAYQISAEIHVMALVV